MISGTWISSGWRIEEIFPVQPCSPSRWPWSATSTITVFDSSASSRSRPIRKPIQWSVIVTSAAYRARMRSSTTGARLSESHSLTRM